MTRRQTRTVFLEKTDQPTVMVEVPVAQYQSLHLGEVDAHDLQVVDQRVGRVAEVQQQVARLGPGLGLQRQR